MLQDNVYENSRGVIGYLVGPIFGSQFFDGGISNHLITTLFDNDGVYQYLPLFGGIALLIMLLTGQDGVAPQVARQIETRRGRRESTAAQAADSHHDRKNALALEDDASNRRAPVGEPVLVVDGAGVRYSGVVAVDSLSLQVRPGEIVGLIGSNGAGKTSAIEVITLHTGPRRIRQVDSPGGM